MENRWVYFYYVKETYGECLVFYQIFYVEEEEVLFERESDIENDSVGVMSDVSEVSSIKEEKDMPLVCSYMISIWKLGLVEEMYE